MMKLRSNETDEQAQRGSAPGPSRRSSFSLPIVATLFYVALVLGFALFTSSRLFDWTRSRMLDNSALATIDSITASLNEAAQPAMNAASSADAGQVTAVDQAPQPDAVSEASAPPAIPAINVLLLGTDARPDETGPPLTDTMILLTLDPQTGSVGMLSLPRDLWVPIPGMDVTTKINTAYRLGETRGYPGGGPQLAKDTVSSFIGEPVQYYARVSFDGFKELIDLIGGVEVVVPTTIHDENYPTSDYGTEVFHLDAGVHHMDGETALKYVRTRHADSDYGRARRQQQVIRSVADKVMRADMLPTLIAKAPRLLYTMRSSIETDMPMAVALSLANYLNGASLTEIRQLVLDGRYGEETYSEEGAWILLPDRTRVRAALNAFFSPVPGDGNAVAQSDRGWVRIEVLNGTGESGVAARARDILQRQGWQVLSIGDADRSDYGHTLIINYGVSNALVEQVSNDLNLEPNISTLEGLNVEAPVDMRIVIGQDFLETEGR